MPRETLPGEKQAVLFSAGGTATTRTEVGTNDDRTLSIAWAEADEVGIYGRNDGRSSGDQLCLHSHPLQERRHTLLVLGIGLLRTFHVDENRRPELLRLLSLCQNHGSHAESRSPSLLASRPCKPSRRGLPGPYRPLRADDGRTGGHPCGNRGRRSDPVQFRQCLLDRRTALQNDRRLRPRFGAGSSRSACSPTPRRSPSRPEPST